MKIIPNLLILIFIIIAQSITNIAFGEDTRTAREQQVSYLDKYCIQESIVISTDNMHFAYISTNATGMYAVHDKKQHFSYYEIAAASLILSPDSMHLAYIARQRYGNWFAVVDGSMKKAVRGDITEIKTKSLIFSPDSMHIAYIAKGAGDRWGAVLDEREGNVFDDIIENSLAFSPDSKHLAYFAGNMGKWTVVVDEEKGREYGYVPWWSKIVWLSPDTLCYHLIDINNDVYVIKETLRPE